MQKKSLFRFKSRSKKGMDENQRKPKTVWVCLTINLLNKQILIFLL